MTLTDPREALAEQSSFIDYLVGIAGLARMVHTLAADVGPRSGPPVVSDDFVHLLLGVASLGESIEKLAEPALMQRHSQSEHDSADSAPSRWLR
jgi:hypothetical protein